MEIVKVNKMNCDAKYLDKGCENLLNSKKKLIDMSPEELDICYNYLIQGNDYPSTNYKKYSENHLVDLNLSKHDSKMRPKEFNICNGLSQVNYTKKLPVTKNQYSQSSLLLELPQISSLVLPNQEQKVKQVQRKRTDKDLVNLSKFDTKTKLKEFNICNGLSQVNYGKNLPVSKNQYSQSPPLLELPQNSPLVLPNKELKVKRVQRKCTDKDLVNLNLSKSDTKMRPKEFDIMSQMNYANNLLVTSNQYSQSPPLLELPQNSSLVLPNKELKIKQSKRRRTEKDLLNLSKPDTKLRPKEFNICDGQSQVNYSKNLPVTKTQYFQSPSLLELPQNSSLVLPNQELKVKQVQRKRTDKDLVNLNLSKPDTKMRPKEFDICNGLSQMNYMKKLPGTKNQYSQSTPLLELPQKSTLVLPNKEQKVKQAQRKRTEKDLVNLSKPDTKMKPKEFEIMSQVNYTKNFPVTSNQYSQSPPLVELPQNSSLVLPNKELKVKQAQRKRAEKDLENLSKPDTKMRPKEFNICNGVSQVNYTMKLPGTRNQNSQSPPLLELPHLSSLVLPNKEPKIKLVQRKRVKTHGLSPVVNVNYSNTISNSEDPRKELGPKRKYSSRKTENLN
ncbi:UNVERIFIED_CONTAM: hypothetical protein RMT77_000408 [Armadillidium vulgare]